VILCDPRGAGRFYHYPSLPLILFRKYKLTLDKPTNKCTIDLMLTKKHSIQLTKKIN
jgi:hypothetical protein